MSASFQHKKSLGQHFLTSEVVPGWMADAANIEVGDVVLEIGPGTGALTRTLLERNARVIALEADQRAIDILNETFSSFIASNQLVIHHCDVRTLDLSTIPGIQAGAYKIVANIPYYLSGFLFRTFLETEITPRTIVFLVQKEVAQRIARDPKESLLSLSVKAYGTPAYIKTVTRGHFTPPPAVDSAIIAIANISKNNFEVLDEAFFFQLLHIGFGSRRKQLLGNLSKEFDRAFLETTFDTLDLDRAVRAEDVSLPQWLELSHTLAIQAKSTA